LSDQPTRVEGRKGNTRNRKESVNDEAALTE
jgi:hypothetical protein